MEKRDEQKTIPTADAKKTGDVLYEELIREFREFCNCSDLLVQKLKETEKQLPKKVTHCATRLSSCTCPTCGNCLDKFIKFEEKKTRVIYEYCHFCGQKLDWEDEVKTNDL